MFQDVKEVEVLRYNVIRQMLTERTVMEECQTDRNWAQFGCRSRGSCLNIVSTLRCCSMNPPSHFQGGPYAIVILPDLWHHGTA